MRGSIIVIIGVAALCYISATDAFSVRFASPEEAVDGKKSSSPATKSKKSAATDNKSADENSHDMKSEDIASEKKRGGAKNAESEERNFDDEKIRKSEMNCLCSTVGMKVFERNNDGEGDNDEYFGSEDEAKKSTGRSSKRKITRRDIVKNMRQPVSDTMVDTLKDADLMKAVLQYLKKALTTVTNNTIRFVKSWPIPEALTAKIIDMINTLHEQNMKYLDKLMNSIPSDGSRAGIIEGIENLRLLTRAALQRDDDRIIGKSAHNNFARFFAIK